MILAIGVGLGGGRWYYLNYVAEPPPIVWQKYSPDLLAKLRTGKRPILIHFSMEYTLSRDSDMSLIARPLEVRWAVARTGAAVVLADMIERTPEMDREHEQLGGVNLSYTVVIFPGSPERVVLSRTSRTRTLPPSACWDPRDAGSAPRPRIPLIPELREQNHCRYAAGRKTTKTPTHEERDFLLPF